MLDVAEGVDSAIRRLESRLPEDFSEYVWERVTSEVQKQVTTFFKVTKRR